LSAFTNDYRVIHSNDCITWNEQAGTTDLSEPTDWWKLNPDKTLLCYNLQENELYNQDKCIAYYNPTSPTPTSNIRSTIPMVLDTEPGRGECQINENLSPFIDQNKLSAFTNDYRVIHSNDCITWNEQAGTTDLSEPTDWWKLNPDKTLLCYNLQENELYNQDKCIAYYNPTSPTPTSNIRSTIPMVLDTEPGRGECQINENLSPFIDQNKLSAFTNDYRVIHSNDCITWNEQAGTTDLSEPTDWWKLNPDKTLLCYNLQENELYNQDKCIAYYNPTSPTPTSNR